MTGPSWRAAESWLTPVPSQAARWHTVRRYWQIMPLAVVLWALDAVDKFRDGAQAAGLTHAPVIDQASGPIGGAIAEKMKQKTNSHPPGAAPPPPHYTMVQRLMTRPAGVT